MKEWMMFLIILIPVLGGISIPLVPIKSRKIKNIYIETIVIINSLLVACLIFYPPEGRFEIVNFIQKLSLSLRMDGMSAVFGNDAGMLAALVRSAGQRRGRSGGTAGAAKPQGREYRSRSGRPRGAYLRGCPRYAPGRSGRAVRPRPPCLRPPSP